jgi:hypothetical protein
MNAQAATLPTSVMNMRRCMGPLKALLVEYLKPSTLRTSGG